MAKRPAQSEKEWKRLRVFKTEFFPKNIAATGVETTTTKTAASQSLRPFLLSPKFALSNTHSHTHTHTHIQTHTHTHTHTYKHIHTHTHTHAHTWTDKHRNCVSLSFSFTHPNRHYWQASNNTYFPIHLNVCELEMGCHMGLFCYLQNVIISSLQ